MDNTNLNLNFKAPLICADGQVVAVRDDGMVDVLFWQARGQNNRTIEADVVAGVRYISMDGLKQLKKAIDDTIKKHETREP